MKRRLGERVGWYFRPDEPPTNAPAQTAGEAGSSSNAGAAGGQPGSPQTGGAAATGSATTGSAEAKFTQTDIDRIVKDRLAEEGRKAQAAAKKVADASEATRLADQQKWEELANRHAARVAELEPLGEQVKAYETIIAKQLETRIAGLSPEAKKAVESLPAGLTTLQKLDWLTSNEVLFAKPTPPNVNAKDGQTGSGTEGMTDAQKRELAAIYGVKAEYIR